MSSKMLAITGPIVREKDAKTEKVGQADPKEKIVPPVEVLRVHSALLLAAESTIGSKPIVPVLGGALLHRAGDVGRIAAMDGNKMFVASYALEQPIPSWLTAGIIVSADAMKKRLQLIMGMSDNRMIKITHTAGSGFVLLSDEDDAAVFKVDVIRGPYPDYTAKIGADSFAVLDADGQPQGREWETIGINSQYLKHCGDIAKLLDAGLPKKERNKAGMIVRAFNSGKPTAPLIFDFSTWPGAILVMLPARGADQVTHRATAALMAPAVKLTLAALRAHATRQLAWAEAATDPIIKADHEAKAAEFVRRVAEIVTRTQAQAILADDSQSAPEPIVQPEPEPVIAPEPEPVVHQEPNGWDESSFKPHADPEPEPEPEPEPQPEPIAPTEEETRAAQEEATRPETKRTKINVRKKKAA